MHIVEPVPGVLIVALGRGLELHVIDYAAAWYAAGRRLRYLRREAWGVA